MALVVHNLSLGLDEAEDLLRQQAARKLRVKPEAIQSLRVIRKSLDARPRHMRWTYSVVVEVPTGQRGVQGHDVRLYSPPPKPRTSAGTEGAIAPPAIVGTGPAGMFAALLLAEAGYRPIVIDRGQDVSRRHLDVHTYVTQRKLNTESNLLFGEGGAGAYSDGKLLTRVHDDLVDWVLQQFVAFGADPSVAVIGKPHVGSDRLPGVALKMRKHILSLGGQFLYGHCVQDVELSQGKIRALRFQDGQRIGVSCVLLAIGHSARDTYRMLARRGVTLSARPFQMGVRIEHPQGLIDRAQLGEFAARPELAPADYHLVARGAGGDRDVYSFCMCPGGTILPANHQEQTICTNGGSKWRRDSGRANSALVTTVQPGQFGEDPLEGLAMQESLERACFLAAGGDYSIAAQRVTDFLADRASVGSIESSCPIGSRACDLNALLPRFIVRAIHNALPVFDGRIPGFAGPEAVLLGPETRASCPVRIDRDPATRASVSADNLYPAGEGAGYAGGIVSSAIDGLRSAEMIIARYAPVK